MNNWKRNVSVFMLIAIIQCLGGCVTQTWRSYEGELRPINEVSFILAEKPVRLGGFWSGYDSFRYGFTECDGITLSSRDPANVKAIEVLPGTHTVTASWVEIHTVTGGLIDILIAPPTDYYDHEHKFNCRAGYTYILHSGLSKTSDSFDWSVEEIKTETRPTGIR